MTNSSKKSKLKFMDKEDAPMVEKLGKKNDFKRENKILLGILLLFFIKGVLKAYIAWNLGFEGTVFSVRDMLHLAEQSNYWMKGINPLSNPAFYSTSHAYPPLFPIVVGFISLISSIPPIKVMLLLSPFSSPLIFFSFYFFLSKIIGKDNALVLSFVFFSGTMMFGGGGVLQPKVIDWIIFPSLLYFFLNDKKGPFIILSLVIIYQHGLFPLPFIFALLMYSILYTPNKLKEFAIIFLLSTPLVYFMAESTSTLYMTFYSTRQVFEYLIRLKWNLQYILIFLGISGIVYFLLNDSEHPDLVKISLLWIFFSVPILYFRVFRFFHYTTIPMSILGGLMLLDLESSKTRAFLIFISILIGVIYQLGSVYELLSIIL